MKVDFQIYWLIISLCQTAGCSSLDVFFHIFFSKFDAVVYWEEVMETKNDLIVNLIEDLIVNLIEFGYKLS